MRAVKEEPAVVKDDDEDKAATTRISSMKKSKVKFDRRGIKSEA